MPLAEMMIDGRSSRSIAFDSSTSETYVEPVELERRVLAAQQRARLVVVALGVQAEDVGQLHGQRRVDVDGKRAGCGLLLAQALQLVDHLLRALERERRDDDLAAALVGPSDDRGQLVSQLLDRAVQPIAVGALGDQALDAAGHLGVAQDRQVVAPEVAGEGEAQRLPVVLDVEHDDGAAQHVPGVEEGHRDARRDRLPAVVGQTRPSAPSTVATSASP